jgi:hypothetical protein
MIAELEDSKIDRWRIALVSGEAVPLLINWRQAIEKLY